MNVSDTPSVPAIAHSLATDEAPDATSIHIQMFQTDKNLLRKACQDHPLFCQVQVEDFMEALTCWEIDDGKVLFEEGKKPLYFYVLKEGSVQITSLNHVSYFCTPGVCFGEQGLSSSTQRMESACALSNTCFWRMSASHYLNFLHHIRLQQLKITSEAVTRFSLFADLPQSQIPALLPVFTPLKYAFEATIVTQGEPGDCLFFIVSGQVTVTESETQKRSMGPGEWFGEQAILYNCPRTASVTASSPEVACLSLSKRALEGQLGKSVYQQIYKNTQRIALDRSVPFSQFPEDCKNRLIDSMQIETFELGETIIRAGTWKGFMLWVVVCGSLRCGGECYGVYCCLGDEMVLGVPEGCFEEDVIADHHEVAVASIGRVELEECLSLPNSLPSSRISMLYLSQIRLFDGLSHTSIAKLCSNVQLVTYSPNTVILHEKRQSAWIYVIKSGAVMVYKAKRLIRIPTIYDFFGELNILPDSSKWVTVVSEGFTECWALGRDRFEGEFCSSLQVRYREWERKWAISGLRELTPVATLSSSASTIVSLAISTYGHLYALKIVPKDKVVERGRQCGLAMERNVLLRLNHPFIPHLLKTFQNEQCVFFLSDFVNGSSLFDVMSERRVLQISDARFYAGAILLVLEYLHCRRIIHRDIKPENVLLGADGYIQLIDFSSAKLTGRTHSVIGTPQFMAPEVILGKSYDSSVDLWSLGIVLFEMLTGGLPFAQPEEDPYTVCSLVLTEPLVIPGGLIGSVETSALLQQLLSRYPQERGSATSLKSHPFFSDFPFVGAT